VHLNYCSSQENFLIVLAGQQQICGIEFSRLGMLKADMPVGFKVSKQPCSETSGIDTLSAAFLLLLFMPNCNELHPAGAWDCVGGAVVERKDTEWCPSTTGWHAVLPPGPCY
jgi:hypothetical protein